MPVVWDKSSFNMIFTENTQNMLTKNMIVTGIEQSTL